MRILQGNSQLGHTHGRISTPERAMMMLPHGDPKDEGKKELGSLGMSLFFFLFFLQETGKVFRQANRSKFRLAR